MSRHFTAVLAAACLIASPAARAGGPAPVDAFGDPLPAGAVARLGSSRLRHACIVLAWAPDGKAFASAGQDKMIRVWDASDGRRLREFKPSADGKIGVRGHPGAFARWGLDDLKSDEAPSITGVEALTPTRATSADGNTAAGRGRDVFVHIWDVEKSDVDAKVKLDRPILSTFALAPDGRLLKVATPSAATRLHDAASGAELRPLVEAPGGTGPQGATVLAFTPDGRMVFSVLGKDLSVWETATGRRRHDPQAVINRL